jgi:MoxR-like ATPase
LLDNKDKFIYKGRTINIADGFMVIGTMNLKVNGSVYSLPEPLIDRCADIVEYIPTIKMLERALYNPQEGGND